MYCKNCGSQIDDNAVVCPNCGTPTDNYNAQQRPQANVQDSKSTGFAVLGFFFPLVGLILYLVWKDTMPLKAHSCGKGALIGVIVYVVFIILYVILAVVVIGAAANAGAMALPSVLL